MTYYRVSIHVYMIASSDITSELPTDFRTTTAKCELSSWICFSATVNKYTTDVKNIIFNIVFRPIVIDRVR
jgi:hypothetical protein